MDLADRFNQAPRTVPKYVAVTSTGLSANGIPVLLMPFTYATRSYTAKEQAETNIHYLTPQKLPAGRERESRGQDLLPSRPGIDARRIHHLPEPALLISCYFECSAKAESNV